MKDFKDLIEIYPGFSSNNEAGSVLVLKQKRKGEKKQYAHKCRNSWSVWHCGLSLLELPYKWDIKQYEYLIRLPWTDPHFRDDFL